MSTEKPDAQPYLLPPEREIHPARVNATVRALREAQAEVNRLASVERKTQATLRRLRRRLEACEGQADVGPTCPACRENWEQEIAETEAAAEDIKASRRLVVEALADDLYAALKAYYRECGCQQAKMDKVNQAAYAALRKYENWSGK